MNTVPEDVRYVLRALGKRPVYALVCAFVLTLAIGANTTVFSVFNGFFLRPLPYSDDDGLVIVHNTYPRLGIEDGGTSLPDYLDRREQARSLEELAIVALTRRTLEGDGPPEHVTLAQASPSLLSVLGMSPLLGRAFAEQEATPGDDGVILLSYRLWRTHFGQRREVLGRDIRLDGERFRIIGVMPRGFGYPNQEVDAWIPLAFTPEQAGDDQRGQGIGTSVGRLRPGATVEELDAELHAIVLRTAERMPEMVSIIETTGFTGRARPLREYLVSDLEPMLLMLHGIVLAVLLIACANVANLQLSRLAARRRELSLRAALGASRRRLARLVLVESMMLALLGGIGGVALASGGLTLVRKLGLDRASEGFQFTLDATVLGFTAGAALVAALASALLPLMALMRDGPARALHGARPVGIQKPGNGFRGALVVLQIALGVSLLIAAGLLTKSFYQLQRQGPGFEVDNLWTAAVTLPRGRYENVETRAAFYEQALEELSALPGVSEAGLTSVLPFSDGQGTATIAVDGHAPPAGAPPPIARLRSISDNFFRSLGVPMIAGRNFAATETERVAIIDETMSNRFWPGQSPLGKRVRNAADPQDQWYTVIGVAASIRHTSLAEEQDTPAIYWHYKQRPSLDAVFALRTSTPPEPLTLAARDAILRVDPGVALHDTMPMDVRVLRSLGSQRAPMALTLVFAAVALTLAIVGVYSVLTWAVTQRTGEIGVRVALGARPADILGMVIAQGARFITVGLVLGIAGALALGRLMSSHIHDVSPADGSVIVVSAVCLTAAALVATWLPARRAARIDATQALREG